MRRKKLEGDQGEVPSTDDLFPPQQPLVIGAAGALVGRPISARGGEQLPALAFLLRPVLDRQRLPRRDLLAAVPKLGGESVVGLRRPPPDEIGDLSTLVAVPTNG